ncbi:SMI1 / KNR4 family protein [Caballeronia catudaia]|uniref:SMI1 / KNR4 family protein n=1 Tax=Caballeronia catudaia TaxID=1777136 RepID=A0A158D7E8_9BURK|nr:SMI1/KNR4 family protein [Caballeronia catudaia]SAK89707.1 SMI1 / KNR4 family protein [Caballeronia catudaia]
MEDETYRALVDDLRAALGGDEWPLAARVGDIDECERRAGVPMSPSYRAFLLIQDGWPDYANGFTIVGADSAKYEAALRDIGETVDIERDEWRQTFGEDTPEAVARYEQEGSALNRLEADYSPYVPHKICFGTDFNGGLLFFDPKGRNARGEMRVFRWYVDSGTQAIFESFADMLRADLADAQAEKSDAR